MKYLIIMMIMLSGCGSAKNSGYDASNKNILTIGDSIGAGYLQDLKNDLSPFGYNVHHEDEHTDGSVDNSRNTYYTLQSLPFWFKESINEKVGTVIWNNGIWNTPRKGFETPGENPLYYNTSDAQYEADLIKIATFLQDRHLRVIFVNTSIIRCDGPFDPDAPIRFNKIANRVLGQINIQIVDMYSLVKDHPEWNITPCDLHYNSEGTKKQAALITSAVLFGGPL